MSSDNSEFLRLKSRHHVHDEAEIEKMMQYFKVEDEQEALLDFIRKNRIPHDRDL